MEYIKLMRLKHYIKNLFVFAALLFSGEFFNMSAIKSSILAFIAFCLICSCVYTMNDVVDVEKDKIHPKKCKRPIASGKITKNQGIIFGIILATMAIVLALYVDKMLLFIIGLYLINNILYSFKMKNIVLLDAFSIAIGFVLRVWAGAIAIGVPVSSWIILCTLFLSLFLAFGKRQKEIALLKGDAGSHRIILQSYDEEILNKMITITLTATLVCYALYTSTNVENPSIIFTTIFVTFGALRYSYVIHITDEGNPTDIVLSDKPILITVLLWAISCLLIIAL